jgi:hypothetical protein
MLLQTKNTILNINEIQSVKITENDITVLFKGRNDSIILQDPDMVEMLKMSFAAGLITPEIAKTQSAEYSKLVKLQADQTALKAKIQQKMVLAEIAEMEEDLEYIEKYGIQEFIARGQKFPPPIVTPGGNNVQ